MDFFSIYNLFISYIHIHIHIHMYMYLCVYVFRIKKIKLIESGF